MLFYSRRLKRLLNKWPGKKYLGEFRFMPIFFIGGAGLEFLMINWHVGEVNFYKTYKKRRVEELVELRLQELQDTSSTE